MSAGGAACSRHGMDATHSGIEDMGVASAAAFHMSVGEDGGGLDVHSTGDGEDGICSNIDSYAADSIGEHSIDTDSKHIATNCFGANSISENSNGIGTDSTQRAGEDMSERIVGSAFSRTAPTVRATSARDTSAQAASNWTASALEAAMATARSGYT